MHTEVLQELCDVRYRYADAVDRMDWQQYRDVFTDPVDVAVTSDMTKPADDYVTFSADDWVDRVATMIPGLAATQHYISNPQAEQDADRAVLTTYMRADHFLDFDDPAAWYAIGGSYRDDLVRTDAGWKIQRLRLQVYWQRGVHDVLVRARDAVGSGRPAKRISR